MTVTIKHWKPTVLNGLLECSVLLRTSGCLTQCPTLVLSGAITCLCWSPPFEVVSVAIRASPNSLKCFFKDKVSVVLWVTAWRQLSSMYVCPPFCLVVNTLVLFSARSIKCWYFMLLMTQTLLVFGYRAIYIRTRVVSGWLESTPPCRCFQAVLCRCLQPDYCRPEG